MLCRLQVYRIINELLTLDNVEEVLHCMLIQPKGFLIVLGLVLL